jgi:DNA-binding CsgD family transcriptional regulator
MPDSATSVRRIVRLSRHVFRASADSSFVGGPANRQESLEQPLGEPPKKTGSVLRRWAGDLPEGVISVAALLGMLVLDVRLWLAIALAVVTYVGVTLLRPDPVSPTPEVEDSGQTGPIGEAASVAPVAPTKEAEFAARFGLTPRESEILPFLALRLTDREIADRLCISPKTVMNHTASILGKLGITSRREVAVVAAQHDLVYALPPPPADE